MGTFHDGSGFSFETNMLSPYGLGSQFYSVGSRIINHHARNRQLYFTFFSKKCKIYHGSLKIYGKEMLLHTKNSRETVELGKRIAGILKRGDIVGFTGDLGSGKTTMIKGMVSRLTGMKAKSPTFVLVNEYPGKVPVFHFDLYRIKYIEELSSIGWEEYIGRGIILVEWAERIEKILPPGTIFVRMEIENGKRKIKITGLKGRIENPHPQKKS